MKTRLSGQGAVNDHEARAREIVDPLLFMTAQKPIVLETDALISAIAKALSEETAVLEARNKRLREKYRKGYSSGFSDGYLQAEFDCDAMGAEAFLRQADGLRRSQASILNKQDARISSLEQTLAILPLGEVAEALEPFVAWKDQMENHPHVLSTKCTFDDDDVPFTTGVEWGHLRKAKAVRERIMDLCHASPVPGCETSSLRSSNDDGEAR